MATVSSLYVKVLGDATGFERTLATASTALKAFGTSAEATSKTSSSALRVIGAGFVAAGALAVGAIAKSVQATTQWALSVRQLQLVTGQSAQSASALAAVASRYGIGVDQLNASFGIFQKNIVNGAAGLAKYNVAFRDAEGALLPFDGLLGAAADKFVSLDTAAEKTTFALTAFGRSGKALIPILSLGSEGIKEMEARAAALGLVLGQKDVDAARALSIAHHDLEQSIKGVEIQIGTAFIPIVTRMIDVLTSAVTFVAQLPEGFLAWSLGITAAIGGLILLEKVLTSIETAFTGLAARVSEAGDAVEELSLENTTISQTQALASTKALTAAIQGLSATLGVELPAAAARGSGALIGFSATEAGLGVPTAAAGIAAAAPAGFTATPSGLLVPAAAARATAGVTALGAAEKATTAGLSANSLAVLKNVGELGLLAAAIGAAVYVARQFSQVTEFISTNVDTMTASLEDGTLKTKDLAAALQPQIQQEAQHLQRLQGAARGILGAVPVVGPALANLVPSAQQRALEIQNSIIAQATANLNAYFTAQAVAAQGTKVFDAALQAAFKDAENLASGPLTDMQAGLIGASSAVSGLSGGLEDFTQVSGIDATQIVSSLDDALVKAASSSTGFQDTIDALKGALAASRAAFAQWKAQIAGNLDFVTGNISDFANKANVSFSAISTALSKSLRETRTFTRSLLDISKFGPQGKEVANVILQLGPTYAGLASSIAGFNKQQERKVIDSWSHILDTQKRGASQLANSLDPSFDKVIGKLETMIGLLEKIAGVTPEIKPPKVPKVPPIKLPRIDTSVAAGSLADFLPKLSPVFTINHKPADAALRSVSGQTRTLYGAFLHPPSLDVNTSPADTALTSFEARMQRIQQTTYTAHLQLIQGHHGGGPIFHEGGGVLETASRYHSGKLASDEVPAILQRGEFVIRRSSVDKIGVPALMALNRLHAGGGAEVSRVLERFHDGGASGQTVNWEPPRAIPVGTATTPNRPANKTNNVELNINLYGADVSNAEAISAAVGRQVRKELAAVNGLDG